MTDCSKLLSEFAQQASESAFRELVDRHINLVYSTALRLVAGDTHLAQDITQSVFTDLARKAKDLPRDTSLPGWLHRHTCFTASKAVRAEKRRQRREQVAAEMNALNHDQQDSDFSQLAPILDDAINRLEETDRTAILLRFFEQQDFRSLGAILGMKEDAARMRVNRALDKLHSLLKHRGVSLSAGALATALAAEVITAAPVGLATTISTAALSSVVVKATATKALSMTALQKGWIAASMLAAVGIIIFEAVRAARFQTQVQSLQQQQTNLLAQIDQLRHERDAALNQLASLKLENTHIDRNTHELLRLRSEVTRLRQQTNTSSTLARDYYEKAMKHYMAREYEEELADLNKALELDPNYTEALFSRACLYDGELPMNKRNYALALADYDRFLGLQPNDCSSRHNRALCYEQLRRYDDAIADYTRLIDGPTDFSKIGDGQDKQLATDYYYRGRAYQWYKKDYSKAIADYTEALRLNPAIDEHVHQRRGECYQALSLNAQAQEDFALEKVK